ncbi:MAG: hypothetical protein C0605_10555 [Hyphomicrobiales bacterium]|nr:MAG: hypothetical protein C0605_10555 [Hyphomicrobiales bacterium]
MSSSLFRSPPSGRAAAKPFSLIKLPLMLSALLALLLGPACYEAPALAKSALSELIIHGGKGPVKLQVEIADTPEKRARGLMYRKSMPADQGMLFDFEREQEILMWMKNTLISLDMVFINRAGHVVSIVRDTKPLSLDIISSGRRAWSVLELNAGSAERLSIRPGNRVEHRLIEERKKRMGKRRGDK